MTSTQNTDDWWNGLFKPTFNFTECQDILNIPTITRSESSLSLPSDDIQSVQSLHHILDDIEGDENISRRVWRKERLDKAVKKCMSENNLSVIDAFNCTSVCRNSSTQTDSCIWDSKELKIIRSCVKDFKRKNIKLQANIKDLTSRNEDLNKKNILLEKKLQKRTDKLNEALKANERFNILAETLSSELDECKSRNKHLIERKAMMIDEEKTFQNKIDELQKDISTKEDAIRKQSRKLKILETEFKKILEKSLLAMEEKYVKEVNKLQIKLDEMTSSFQKECHLHRATEKGFQHLLTHFSTTSTDKKTPPDLKSIKYVNL